VRLILSAQPLTLFSALSLKTAEDLTAFFLISMTGGFIFLGDLTGWGGWGILGIINGFTSCLARCFLRLAALTWMLHLGQKTCFVNVFKLLLT
ncbi:hypothetical protein NL302_28895, partial [Klebsiella pneumoniae]|nr:hypothetical protein [Klebsiella pneumoniae]